MARVTHAFPSDLRQLTALRAVVRSVAGQAWDGPADAEGIAQLELAVDEAAANVILHAYEGKQGLPVEAVIDAEPASIAVCLYHEGRPFDPAAVRPPTFDGSRESGYGLYLIRQAVDEVAFFQDERGRQGMRLVKQRGHAAEQHHGIDG